MRITAVMTIGTIALLGFAGPAVAAVNKDVALCRRALAADPEFRAGDYAVKFDRYREGRVRTVRFALKPRGEGSPVIADCVIEKGLVVRVAFRNARSK